MAVSYRGTMLTASIIFAAAVLWLANEHGGRFEPPIGPEVLSFATIRRKWYQGASPLHAAVPRAIRRLSSQGGVAMTKRRPPSPLGQDPEVPTASTRTPRAATCTSCSRTATSTTTGSDSCREDVVRRRDRENIDICDGLLKLDESARDKIVSQRRRADHRQAVWPETRQPDV